MATSLSRRLLHAHEAARLLGLKPQTLAAWRHYGRHPDLVFVRVGRSVRYRQSDVEAFIVRNLQGEPSPVEEHSR